MTFTDTQQQIAELVDDEFAKLNLPGKPKSLYDPVRYTLSLGGKRIRPYFVLSACGICKGAIKEAIPAAIAIELLHNFTLLHDDIMDSASTRRGRPSVFKKWDASTAILSGDAMYAWAFEQLQYYGKNNQFSKKQYYSILNAFLQSAKTVCEGQAYDLDFESVANVTLDDYTQMIRGKTAALINGSLLMGGIVADAASPDLERLTKIGTHIGVGFQIQDDLLDVLADPEKFGKTQGGDIQEGKKTYLYILALKKASAEQKEQLAEIMNKNVLARTDIKKVIDLYRQLGVIKFTQQAIDQHYQQAIEQIELFDESPYRTDLKTFILNLKNREY